VKRNGSPTAEHSYSPLPGRPSLLCATSEEAEGTRSVRRTGEQRQRGLAVVDQQAAALGLELGPGADQGDPLAVDMAQSFLLLCSPERHHQPRPTLGDV